MKKGAMIRRFQRLANPKKFDDSAVWRKLILDFLLLISIFGLLLPGKFWA